MRFDPGSAFAPHTHDGGEEYLVLDGVFQDETGDFPVGSYVRNPPTSRHSPAAAAGATILVKLHQMHPDDRTRLHVNALAVTGECLPLYRDDDEDVRIETWAPDALIDRDMSGGGEVFVISGGFVESGEKFVRWDWLRLPPGSRLRADAGPDGARVWLKTGHLAGMV